jgi:hypothetical protein
MEIVRLLAAEETNKEIRMAGNLAADHGDTPSQNHAQARRAFAADLMYFAIRNNIVSTKDWRLPWRQQATANGLRRGGLRGFAGFS